MKNRVTALAVIVSLAMVPFTAHSWWSDSYGYGHSYADHYDGGYGSGDRFNNWYPDGGYYDDRYHQDYSQNYGQNYGRTYAPGYGSVYGPAYGPGYGPAYEGYGTYSAPPPVESSDALPVETLTEPVAPAAEKPVQLPAAN